MQLVIRYMSLIIIGMMLSVSAVMARDVHKVASKYDVATTTERLEKIFKDKGITLFAKVDHAAGARSVGKKLRPAVLLIFGNPKLGTPLMEINPEVGFDLPLRALIWQSSEDKTWIHVTNPAILNQDYLLGGANGVIDKMNMAVRAMVDKAAGTQAE